MKFVLALSLGLFSTTAFASERICQYKHQPDMTQVTTLNCTVQVSGKNANYMADGHKFVAKLDSLNSAPDAIVGATLNSKPATYMRMGSKGFEIATTTRNNITFGVVDDHPAAANDKPYIGTWSMDPKKGCGDTDDSLITFTPTEIKGYENNCKITSVSKSANDYVYFIIGACMSEGEASKAVTSFSGPDDVKEIDGKFYRRCPAKPKR
ncbi:hypothetical protein FV222_03690 [Methylobacterium sp. WL103]|uniref:hypothetical protein n=1 Tax=Methylobacterium sp. WL103 TaxID=2603891 RepID=UPI0011C7853C|nr:hypothetical protein [Methylobacterium sp. WL103]TXN07012.1 hypothetical protein FV222_03690 [Methylobacterium sp. WL103]